MINGHGFANAAKTVNKTFKCGLKRSAIRASKETKNFKRPNGESSYIKVKKKGLSKKSKTFMTQGNSLSRNTDKESNINLREKDDECFKNFSITHSRAQLEQDICPIVQEESFCANYLSYFEQSKSKYMSSPSSGSQKSKSDGSSFAIYPSKELNIEDIFEIDLSNQQVNDFEHLFKENTDPLLTNSHEVKLEMVCTCCEKCKEEKDKTKIADRSSLKSNFNELQMLHTKPLLKVNKTDLKKYLK